MNVKSVENLKRFLLKFIEENKEFINNRLDWDIQDLMYELIEDNYVFEDDDDDEDFEEEEE